MSAPSSNDPKAWLVNNYLATRWGSCYMGRLLVSVPEENSEVKQLVRSFWDGNKKQLERIAELASELNVTLPTVQPLSSDPADEANIDHEGLEKEVLKHVEEPVKQVIQFNSKMIRPQKDGGSHWSVNALMLARTGEVYFDQVERIKPEASNVALSRHTEALDAEHSRKLSAQLKGELAKANLNESETGMTQDKLNDAVNKNIELLRQYCAVGTLA